MQKKGQFGLRDLFIFTTCCAAAAGGYAFGGPCFIVTVLIIVVAVHYGYKIVLSTAKDPLLGWPLALCVAWFLLAFGSIIFWVLVEVLRFVYTW